MNKLDEAVIDRVAAQLNQNRVRTAQRSMIRTALDRQIAKNRRQYLRGRAISAASFGRIA